MNPMKMMKNTKEEANFLGFFYATWAFTNGSVNYLTEEIYLANEAKSEGLKRMFY